VITAAYLLQACKIVQQYMTRLISVQLILTTMPHITERQRRVLLSPNHSVAVPSAKHCGKSLAGRFADLEGFAHAKWPDTSYFCRLMDPNPIRLFFALHGRDNTFNWDTRYPS
jgi:hypothetical protein